MSKDRRFLDVWIVESNTVYREVPFSVVSDWIQQGRLLENDKLRPRARRNGLPSAAHPILLPIFRVEPDRVEDTAEALEPVELDFRWKRPAPDEDDDVDMIPLIDVSLVLLIFFMLTTSAAGLAAFVPTPQAEYGDVSANPEEAQLNINLEGQGEELRPIFSFSVGGKYLDKDKDSNLATMDEMLSRLQQYLNGQRGRVEVTINAHPDVKSGLVRDLTARLASEPLRSKILNKYVGVSGK